MIVIRKIRNPIVYLAILFALTACGGGGGSSSGGGTTTPTPGTTTPPAAGGGGGGTPIRGAGGGGSVLASLSNDEVSTIETAAAIGTSTVGTKDPFFQAGGSFIDVNTRLELNVAALPAGHVLVQDEGLPFAHRRLEGADFGDSTIEIAVPPTDIRTAWREGWTGQGVNILIADDFGLASRSPTTNDERGTHGYTVFLSAGTIAPQASYFGINAGLDGSDTDFAEGGIFTEDNSAVPNDTDFHVLNLSFGLDPESSASAAQAGVAEYVSESPTLFGPSTTDLSGDIADAVITKSAGNENSDAGFLTDNRALTSHANTEDRVLIVGALNDWAQNNPTQLASYSNFAGTTQSVRDRFLVEFGGSPYETDSYLCDSSGAVDTCNNEQQLGDATIDGTSFSAPRVAGFAALIRDKFPDLSGAQTATILLHTATTHGLTCHSGSARKSPNCDTRVYGQGRVDIETALSPVGNLQ